MDKEKLLHHGIKNWHFNLEFGHYQQLHYNQHFNENQTKRAKSLYCNLAPAELYLFIPFQKLKIM